MTTNQQQKLRGHLLRIEESIGAIRLLLDGVDLDSNLTAQEGVDYMITNLKERLGKVLPPDTVRWASELPPESKLPTTPSLPRPAVQPAQPPTVPPAPDHEVADPDPVDDLAETMPKLTRQGTADLMKWIDNWKAAINGLPASNLQCWEAHKVLLRSVRKYMTDEQLVSTFRHLTEAAYAAGITYDEIQKQFRYLPIPESEPA